MESQKIQIISVDRDAEYEHVFDIRRQVFQVEQQVPEDLEFSDDHISHHFLALYEGTPCGTARWRVTPFGKVKLERFAVLAAYRGKGVGAALVQAVLSALPKGYPVFLNSQIEAVPFYEKLGFIPEGEVFEEADIQHLRMRWEWS